MKYALLTLALVLNSVYAHSKECVVLLHGLARTASSMNSLENKLVGKGYFVANIDYPSRKMDIAALSDLAITSGLEICQKNQASPVNFVTHSLGGILVRHFYNRNNPLNVNRVVMLGPPNKGSEVVDNFKNIPGFELLNGPAGMQLGTSAESVPQQLGAVNFELGVIAGTQSINLILSAFLPNPDDGKVSLESAKVQGMCGFVALPTTHPFMMKNETVINEVISFLGRGRFQSKDAVDYGCEKRS